MKSGDLTPVGLNEEWKLTRRRLKVMEGKHKVLKGVVRRQVAGFKKVRCVCCMKQKLKLTYLIFTHSDHFRTKFGVGQSGEPSLCAAVAHREPEREAEGPGQEDRRSDRQLERQFRFVEEEEGDAGQPRR